MIVGNFAIDNDKETELTKFSKESIESFEKLNDLKKKNDEVVGYIKIKGTKVDSPITQAENNDFYLKKNALKKDSISGSLFLDCYNKSDFSDSNSVVYGHNMKDGSMFGTLMRYKNTDFFKKNRTIILYTPEKKLTYKIFSAYVTNSKEDYDDVSILNKNKVKTFKEWQSKSVYNVNEKFTQDDKILTLSTCTYEYDDARFAVHAKLEKEERYVKSFDNVSSDSIIQKSVVKAKDKKKVDRFITKNGKKYKLKAVNFKQIEDLDIKDNSYQKRKLIASNVLNPKEYYGDIPKSINVKHNVYTGKMGLKKVDTTVERQIKNRDTYLSKVYQNDYGFDKSTANDSISAIYKDKITGINYKVKLDKEKTYAVSKKQWVLNAEPKKWKMTYPVARNDDLYSLGNKLYSFKDAPVINDEIKSLIFNNLHLQKKSKYDIYSSRWVGDFKTVKDSNGEEIKCRVAEYTLYEKMAVYETKYSANFKFPDLTYYNVYGVYSIGAKGNIENTFNQTAVYEPIKKTMANSLIVEKAPNSWLNIIARILSDYLPYFSGVMIVLSGLLAAILFVIGKKEKDDNEEENNEKER